MSAWITQLPSGRFVLLQEQVGLKGWHKELAKFATYKEAKAWAKREMIAVTEGPGRPATSPGKEKYQELGKQILGKLDDLYAQNTAGVSAQILMAHFKESYAVTLAALRWLGGTGQAQWIYRGNETRKFLFPNGVSVGERAKLGPIAEKVLRVLANAADAEGTVSMGYRTIAIKAGLSSHSSGMSHIITNLRMKGYIELLESGQPRTGRANAASTYRVHLKPLDKEIEQSSGADTNDDDLFPPEEAQARFETTLRACAGIAPANDAEKALRADILRVMDLRTRKKGGQS